MSRLTADEIMQLEAMARAVFDSAAYCRFRRERIAAMAMQGLLANPDDVLCEDGAAPETFDHTTRELARRSAKFADALIAELAKPVTP